MDQRWSTLVMETIPLIVSGSEECVVQVYCMSCVLYSWNIVASYPGLPLFFNARKKNWDS